MDEVREGRIQEEREAHTGDKDLNTWWGHAEHIAITGEKCSQCAHWGQPGNIRNVLQHGTSMFLHVPM